MIATDLNGYCKRLLAENNIPVSHALEYALDALKAEIVLKLEREFVLLPYQEVQASNQAIERAIAVVQGVQIK